MPAIEHIIERQRERFAGNAPTAAVPPEHSPEMLLIGCVDARLDIISELGIPKGKALVYRNIAALVQGSQQNDISHMSEAAALEFAIDVMRVKDVVVMGHTDCGGIRACLEGAEHHPDIHTYLQSLDSVRDEVIAGGGNDTAQARAMEEAAVCQSMQNLHSYDVVKRAVEEGRLRLHGWLINTATGAIRQLDHATGLFTEMFAKN
jgi:carbonic anhydrase